MLIAGYYLLLAALLALLFYGLHKSNLGDDFKKQYTRYLAIGAAVWLVYSFVLSATGFLQVFGFPPRIALCLVLPLFAWMAWFFLTDRHLYLVRAIPPAWPVGLQTFRIVVELLLLGAFSEGFISKEPTLEGWNFDMLAGLSAPLLVYMVFNKRQWHAKALRIWNWAGLALLANVVLIFSTLIVAPGLWGYEATPFRPEFGTMPYVLVAGAFMPVAVFLHIFSLAQLKRGIVQ